MPPLSRPNTPRRGPSTTIKVSATFSIAILAAFATVFRQHVKFAQYSTNDATAGAPLPPPSNPSKPSTRIKNEIASLEKELESLQKEFLIVSEEVRALTDSNQDSNSVDTVEKTKKTKTQAQAQARAIQPIQPIQTPKQQAEEKSIQNIQNVEEKLSQRKTIPPDKPGIIEREPKQWWVRKEVFASVGNEIDSSQSQRANDGNDGTTGSIIPMDLSVNHLQRIIRAPGSPATIQGKEDSFGNPKVTSPEDFLPVVLPSDIEFRWRSKARSNSNPGNLEKTTAYRVVVRRAFSSNGSTSIKDGDGGENDVILWDSGKVETKDGLPDVVRCDETYISIGSIVEWRVTVWDSSKPEGRPSTSEWTKFAVGPNPSDWEGKWISHPTDVASFDTTDSAAFWVNDESRQETACNNWKRRKQLPIFRAKVPPLDTIQGEDDEIASALLVVSGLGSFRASMDGEPLSSSGPLDPPLTDFAQRVSYRGFDVTDFLKGESDKPHVVGLSLGSGWWDHRPIKGSFIRLFFFPRGALTCVAQLYITYKSGASDVLIPTGHESSGWQVSKGHILESSLFTGEYIDLKSMASLKGWDTYNQWATITPNSDVAQSWMEPVPYESDTTIEIWRHQLHVKSSAQRYNATIGPKMPEHKMAPIGRLIPHEAPPVLPTERIYHEEVYGLGNGRWIYDFGKAFSGMVRFEEGLPKPIIPPNGEYPRGHSMNNTLSSDTSFITVVYGESLELTTGDINLVVVAGMGLHDSGPRHKSREAGWAESKGGPCYPEDNDAGSLLQRDVYILPNGDGASGEFSNARQSHFTTHSFRFVEICCTEHPPTGLHALSYRTAFSEWGDFSSSNVRINGGYELVKNAMNANMLSVQSDCPHREKIQYGGDIIADSPAAMHFYDMSAFYRKAVFDWRDQQWENGAYAGTSYWLALNDYAGIGQGAGETVWATAPLIMTVRHFQQFGDTKFIEQTFAHHLKWFKFLWKNFDSGMKTKGYHEELEGYVKEGSGLGDWLTMRGRDTWLTHQSFYMAAARSIAYMSEKIGANKNLLDLDFDLALEISKSVKDRISTLYLKNGKDTFTPPEPRGGELSPGPEMSLFSRVVPGEKRCTVLRNYFRRKGHTWPGSEENWFIRDLDDSTKSELISTGELTLRGKDYSMGWSQWHGFNEGIFAVRYSLQTLSNNGFHNVALDKANGFSVGTFEYMLSHNATTLWESWWRSEDLYSHNHPMLGASAEWIVAAVAGVSLHPKTTGGKEVLFWPRFHSANVVEYAGATQGTRRGDFSIAWKFLGLPEDKALYDAATVKLQIRVFVPPDGRAVLRMPEYSSGEGVDSSIKYSLNVPNIDEARVLSSEECQSRRDAKMGFNYNWEFSRDKSTWVKTDRKKAIGTPCQSFLFHSSLDEISWSSPETVSGNSSNGIEVPLKAGLYELTVDKWQLQPEAKRSNGRIGDIPEYYRSVDVGPYCADSDTFEWSIEDATNLI